MGEKQRLQKQSWSDGKNSALPKDYADEAVKKEVGFRPARDLDGK